MSYKIYINLLSNEAYPTYCIIYKYNNQYIVLEATDDYICNPKCITKQELDRNYFELKEFINTSNKIYKKTEDNDYQLLYDNGWISLIKENGKFCFEYSKEEKKDELVKTIDEITYKVLYKKLVNQINMLLKKNQQVDYIKVVIEEVINDINKKNMEFSHLYLECLNIINNVDIEKCYKDMLDIKDNYTKQELLKKLKKEIKLIYCNSRNTKEQNKKIDCVLDAYNYLSKKTH